MKKAKKTGILGVRPPNMPDTKKQRILSQYETAPSFS